jgi:branched-chain amino acid transport system permease protein
MKPVLWTVLAIALVAAPFALETYYVNLASQILIAVILASGLNILVGHAGLTSLCHAAIAGVTSYATIYFFAQGGLPHIAAALGGLLFGLLLSMAFGALALRATGLGFLMITLALGQIAWGLAYRWTSVTGGDNGLGGLDRPTIAVVDLGDPAQFYWLSLAVTALSIVAIWRLVRSPFGATIRGARDQARRMAALGHDVWLIRWLAFAASGFFASISGVLFAYYHQFASPPSLATAASAEALLMVLAGGAGTIAGPILGAAIVSLLKIWVSSYVTRWVMLLGAIFVMIVLFMPGGIVPTLARLKARRASAESARSQAAALAPAEAKP